MKKLLFLGLLLTSIVQCGGWFSDEDLENFLKGAVGTAGSVLKYTSLTTFVFSAPTSLYFGRETYKALMQKKYPRSAGLVFLTLLGGSIATGSGLITALFFQK